MRLVIDYIYYYRLVFYIILNYTYFTYFKLYFYYYNIIILLNVESLISYNIISLFNE